MLFSETTLLDLPEVWSKPRASMALTVCLRISISSHLGNDALLTCPVVWQYPCTPQQGNDFLALVAAVRIHLPEEHYLLTAALPAVKPVLQNIDLRQTAEYLDTINLTAYDFFGGWSHKTGHHAQLYAMSKDEPSGDSSVRYLLSSGVPGKKILLGVPLFGRSFLHTTGPGHKIRGLGGEDGSFEYKQLPRKGAKEQVDKRAIAAYCVGGDGGFVTYDNPDTVKVKANFCMQKGLGVRHFSFGPLFRSRILTGCLWNRGCSTGAHRLMPKRARGVSSRQGSRRCIALDVPRYLEVLFLSLLRDITTCVFSTLLIFIVFSTWRIGSECHNERRGYQRRLGSGLI